MTQSGADGCCLFVFVLTATGLSTETPCPDLLTRRPAANLRRSVEAAPTSTVAASGGGGGGGDGGGQAAGHPQFMPFSAVSSHYAVTGVRQARGVGKGVNNGSH